MSLVHFSTSSLGVQDGGTMMSSITISNLSQAKRYMLKVPVQRRSRETVQSIIVACSRLLLENAYHDITTDKISEVAGVSIGSLYQFFANKEAIVSAVIDDLLVHDIENLRESFSKLPTGSEQDKMKAIIDMAFERNHTDRPLRAALQNVQGLLDYWETRRVYFEHFQRHLLQHLKTSSERDRTTIALVIVSSINNALTLSLLQNHNSEEEARFKQEIYLLITRYIE